jgi:lipoic acid synthetase
MELLSGASRRKADWPLLTKSGLMVGLGESVDELLETFRDIRDTGCDILTVGQYLSPTPRHIPIEKFYTPEEFDFLKTSALEMGFSRVEAAPLVRSSYHAGRHVRRETSAEENTRRLDRTVFEGQSDSPRVNGLIQLKSGLR